MRPPSQVEIKCGLCEMTFKNRRQLKNHLAAAPHKRLSLICVWCNDEKSYRRMVDLKEHVLASHRSRFEIMPSNFLTENNGFWMANYPETYAQVIQPSNENSVEAMKARIEVLEFIQRVGKTVRTKEQWIQGWKCPRGLICEEEKDHEPPKRTYSASRPNIYEDMELQQITIGLGQSTTVFTLDLDVTVRDYKVTMKDEVLKEPKMLDALIRRMTALMTKTYICTRTFSIPIEDENLKIISKVVARKLSIKEDMVKEIRTTEELFPAKKPRMSIEKPLSPLQTPFTSDIVLEEDQGQDYEKDKEKGKEHGSKKRKNEKQKLTEDEKQKQKRAKKKEADMIKEDAVIRKDTEKAEKSKQEQLQKEEELRSKMRTEVKEAEERRKKEEKRQQEEKKRKEEENLKKEEERQLEEERIRKDKEESLRKEERRLEEERIRKEEENLRKEEERRLEEERIRKEKEENLRKEMERQQEEGRIRKEEESSRIEEETRRHQEGYSRKENEESQGKEMERLQEEERIRNEEEKQKKGEMTRQEEDVGRQERERDENTRNQGIELQPDKEHRTHETYKEMTLRDRAIRMLKKGGMPLFPAGRREWDKEEVVTLVTLPTTIKWPPKTWKNMTPEQKYFNWEFASMALELSKGIPLQMTKEELLIKYNFLALPGSKMPTMEEDKTTQVKSRFYLYSVLKEIVNKAKTNDNTDQLLTMLEAAVTKRDISLDELCDQIDSVGVNLRLGDEL